ncbi:MAG: hypothetical protein AMS26_15315, partial [Bacteroides sp. SM23_62]
KILISIILATGITLYGADWIVVSPVTDRIIMLKFDDGYIDHYGYHESTNACVTYHFPLDTTAAADPLNFTVSSPDDPAFTAGLHPLDIGRKSKGHDFSRRCNWDAVRQICDNDYIKYHYLFLFLGEPIKDGHTYVFELNHLAENYNIDTLFFDDSKIRSDLIHVNQVGFLPGAERKYAYLSCWLGDKGPLDLDDYAGTAFHVRDLYTGESLFQDTIRKRLDIETSTEYDLPQETVNKFISMSDVWECDFSAFNTPGEYVISLDNTGCSYPFRIGEDIYREAHYHTTRALYHHRAGIALEEQYTDWYRPRNLHPDDSVVKFQYTTASWFEYEGAENGDEADVLFRVIPDAGITTWGWYMDAGDWDGYYSHTKIPRYLMTAWELAPEKFADGELNIPESGNGIPDILDEARWLIDYMDRTRGPDGGVAGTRIHPDFHELEGDGIPSWEDNRIWTIYGEDVQTTFTFAGLAAHLSYCYDSIGKDSLAVEWFGKAEDAYDWAISHMESASDHVNNTWAYAAACLYKASGDPLFQTHFIDEHKKDSGGPYAADNKHFAVWAYITTHHANMDVDQTNECLAYARNLADIDIVNTARDRSFRVGFNWNMPINVGQTTTPRVFPALVAHHVTGEQKYLTAALTTCDYFLGGNPLNMLWMTGYGDQHPLQVLHLDTWYREDGNNDEMIPGIIPYGATNRDWLPNNGPWAATFARERVYPEMDDWPVYEAYFDNRYAVPTNEYTVHQTIVRGAAIYGLLSGTADGSFVPNKKPLIEIASPQSAGEITAGEDLLIVVNATDEDGTVVKVEFYNDWHKLGESHTAPFSFIWKNIPEGNYDLYAIAVDNEGARGKSGKLTTNVGGISPVESYRMQVYPTPANEYIKIAYYNEYPSETTLSIIDVSGKVVISEDFGLLLAGDQRISQPVTDLPAGVYLLHIHATCPKGEVKMTRRFIVN